MCPSLDHPESCRHAGESGRVGRQLGLQLGTPQAQHPAQLGDVHPVVEDREDLLEGEAEVLERDDPVEPAQLFGVVEPVPAGRVDRGGPQQPDRVVVAQHPDRYPAELGEVSDTEHGPSYPGA
jgi:hypothetical protein